MTVPKGRILIMDDEELVRTVAAKMLAFLEYEAESCKSGEDAVAIYRERMAQGKRFDAVLLDWRVPGGMDGLATLDRLRDLDSGVKGILSSGGGETGAEDAPGLAAVIPKPYELKTLRETLERTLTPRA